MKRYESDIGQTYHAFWATLVPLSNRQTGFSLQRPTRRSFVQFCRIGFCFSYHLEYNEPDAQVEFALYRSDDEQIYNSLVRQRKQIDTALSGQLRWLPDAHNPEHQGPYHALVRPVPCLPLRDLNCNRWPEIQSQMIDAMVHLEQAVVPHLQRWLLDD